MVVFGQEWLCLDKICFVRAKVVVCGTAGCNWGKVVIFLESGYIQEKWFYSGKSRFSGKSGSIQAIVVVIGQSGCIRVKGLYSANFRYSGKSGSIGEIVVKGLYSGKSCCFRTKNVVLGKVVLLGQKLLY